MSDDCECPTCRCGTPPAETAVIITPPADTTQILVRIPAPYDPAQIGVDYRPTSGAVWTPHQFWDNTVTVNIQ